ncbi:SLY1 [Candida margitis]|uniref:SLY1 n=1 Tax=Candida margitis TaxID=1775924 RepID=UPI002225D0A6|nr:SLY1 [Candida margitis]KAI5970329.1 SLY1 [Candida margitis]
MSLQLSPNLRNRQISILERMLHLNKDGSADLTLASKSEEIIWKVLVLDQKSRNILSSVLRVNDLLRCGITVHALINQQRSKLPDVPVIYFVEPSKENISTIIHDLNDDKYDTYYINFTSHLPRDLLEEFAKQVALSGKASRIKQVWDQYLDFVVTEPNLFSLNLSSIFTIFNTSQTKEETIHDLVGTIADGLLSLIISMDVVPIIRAQQHGPAEFVAQELDLKLREYLSNAKSLGNDHSTALTQRPVLILLDRNFDLASMFAHSWIYQCMVSDVYSLKRNTIKLRKTTKDKNGIESESVKNYDIDPRDFFWSRYAQLPFPDVVENADVELNAYKQEAKEITNKTGITSLDDIDQNSTSSTANIQQAVEKLPELTARKATLDMHMDILSNLINELQAKNLDTYFEIEQNAGGNHNDTKILKEFMDLLNNDDAKQDTSLDKLRTLIILTLVSDHLSPDYISKFKSILLQHYPDLDMSAYEYILKFKEHSKLANLSNLSDSYSGGNNHNGSGGISSSTSSSNAQTSSALLSGLSSKLYGLTEGRISEGLSSIASKIKNFIPERNLLPITKIVEAIMDPANSNQQSISLTDEYLYFDPKARGGGHSKPPKRQSYSDSIVFVVGGGNYLEYVNLTEWSGQHGGGEAGSRNGGAGASVGTGAGAGASGSTAGGAGDKGRLNVIYGSTDILSATEFLKECEQLSKN